MIILVTVAASIMATAAIAYFDPFLPRGYGNTRESEVFKDCDECPEMLPIPPGTFIMGELGRRKYLLSLLGRDVGARRVVSVTRPPAFARYEVTFAQWEACVADGGCGGYVPKDEGFGRDQRPVINVSWNHAQLYASWLSEKTGHRYRLPSEAEWEYVARAGTKSWFPWGRFARRDYANYGSHPCPPCAGAVGGRDKWINTAPVGQFPPNRFGIHDTSGNVYEWTEDCHDNNLPNTAVDSSPVVTESCNVRSMRGGTWYSNPERVTSSYRAYNPPHWHDHVIGFRVVRDM
jgi:formylglycine-generating enzyme required for sulfatase activity